MAFFICAVERKKREREEKFIERVYELKKIIEKELKSKLKLICHFEEGKVMWIELVLDKQKHPFLRKKGC